MKLTKYAHACFTVEQNSHLLVVDPGSWTTDIGTLQHVAAILITHEHADHYSTEHLQQLAHNNPGAVIITHADVAAQLATTLPVHTVKPGDVFSVGPFNLAFFGGQHAIIHASIPAIANIGVLINDTLYYPGDSFALPHQHVDVLAAPAAAPWLTIGETIDFITAVHPGRVFPTHDAILSDTGKGLVDRILSPVAVNIGTTYERLDGKTIDI